MAERITELVCSSFYLSEGTFASIPLSVDGVSKSESMPVEGSLKPRASIDKEFSVFDVVFCLSSWRNFLVTTVVRGGNNRT